MPIFPPEPLADGGFVSTASPGVEFTTDSPYRYALVLCGQPVGNRGLPPYTSAMPAFLARIIHTLQSPPWRLRWLPLALAVCAYGILLADPATRLGQTLVLSQYGVFLLWQPLVKPGFRLTGRTAGWLLLGGVLLALLADGWLLTLWLSVLCALLGSQVLADRLVRLRRFHLGVLAHLLLVLVVLVAQLGREAALPEGLSLLLRYGMPASLLLLALVPVESPPRPPGEGDTRQEADFLYALLFWLLLMVCVLGSLALRQLYALPHLEALSFTLLWLGGGLALLAWLWSPRGGFAGIGAAFTVRLLQLGSPYERWSAILAQQAAQDSTPQVFMADAAATLTALPTITGGVVLQPEPGGPFGLPAAHQVLLQAGEVRLRLYSTAPVSPLLGVQYQRVAELLNQFYVSKCREARLREQAYVEAVHETGARLTHDIKNLLQSLKVLVEISSQADAARSHALFARQLPEIARRLEATLARLHNPDNDSHPQPMPVARWWESVQARLSGLGIELDPLPAAAQGDVDAHLFDTVLDNLLGNAIEKREREPQLHIRVGLAWDKHAHLTVSDTGSAIPAERAAQLLQGPVPSASGFGLGLYHSSRLAQARDAWLELSHNETGRVTFCLHAPAPRPTPR